MTVGKPSGVGVGFRVDRGEELLARMPEEIRWLEIHPENYMQRGGRFSHLLAQVRERWPLVTHGLTMSFGSPVSFDREYLQELRSLLHGIETPWHSDHACFGGAHGVYLHDLLPLPFTQEVADTLTARMIEARDALDIEIAIENVSYYAPQSDNPLDEIDLLNEALTRADAKLMLDVNNVYVNSRNFGFDPKLWIDRVPVERVIQMHVAGHWLRADGLRIDTHGEAICDGVYELLEYTLKKVGPVPVLLERDNNIPPLDEILREVRLLTEIYDRATTAPTETLQGQPAPLARSAKPRSL